MVRLKTVRAGGGAVWRRTTQGLEVLLVHRPKYDDWTLPKGKADDDEDDPDAALREVAEETGLECDLGPELCRIRYTDRLGRPKLVRYWAMTADPSRPPVAEVPNDEVDEVGWLSLPNASQRLTYRRDVEVLVSLADAIGSHPTDRAVRNSRVE